MMEGVYRLAAADPLTKVLYYWVAPCQKCQDIYVCIYICIYTPYSTYISEVTKSRKCLGLRGE